MECAHFNASFLRLNLFMSKNILGQKCNTPPSSPPWLAFKATWENVSLHDLPKCAKTFHFSTLWLHIYFPVTLIFNKLVSNQKISFSEKRKTIPRKLFQKQCFFEPQKKKFSSFILNIKFWGFKLKWKIFLYVNLFFSKLFSGMFFHQIHLDTNKF